MTKPRKVYVKDVPRAVDENLLIGLRLVLAGHTYTAAAKRVGMEMRTLQMTVTRIREADTAESGEPTQQVERAYP